MSDALAYSVELAAERSSERYYSEKRLQMPGSGLYLDLVELQLKKLGFKGVPSCTLVDSLASLKHGARNSLVALTESGYKYYNDFGLSDSNLSSALYLLDVERDTPSKYLNVFSELKEKMGYKTVHVANDEQLYQVDNIYKISRLKGDVYKTIDVLSEVGYKLGEFKGKKWIHYYDVELIDCLTKADTDEFLKTFHKLKEKLKYKSVRSSLGQIGDILAISQIPGYAKAIDHLAGYGYKLYNKKKFISFLDIQEIDRVSNKLFAETLKDFTMCLYKNAPVEFIEYFKGLGVEDKKVVIKSIFNCNEAFNDHGVVTWLDENYSDLVREIGLGLV